MTKEQPIEKVGVLDNNQYTELIIIVDVPKVNKFIEQLSTFRKDLKHIPDRVPGPDALTSDTLKFLLRVQEEIELQEFIKLVG